MVNLRIAEIKDAEFILEIRNDPTTVIQLHDSRIFNIEQFNEWFITAKPTWFIILSEFRRQGFATQAYHRIFEMYNLVDKYQLEVLDTNVIAIALYEKLDFKEVRRYTFDNYTRCSIVMERDNV